MAYKWEDDECFVQVNYIGSDTRNKCPLPCYAEEVAEGVAVNWSSQSPVGRTGSMFAYTGTADETFSFSFDLHMEMWWEKFAFNSSASNEEKLEYIEQKFNDMISVLKSTAYANYTSGVHPPKTTFVFGLLKISGKVDNVSFAWKGPIIHKRHAVCTVTVNMTSASSKIVSESHIMAVGKAVRGIDF